MKKYDFITVGGATEDITLYTNEGIVINNKEDILRQRLIAFEYGAKLKVDKSFSTFGGGAANAAVGLSKLGFKVSAMVAIGEDVRGEAISRNFRKYNVGINLLQYIKKESSGFSCLIVGQENEHVVFSNRAANKFLKVGPKEIKKIESAEWVYMTSLSGGRWRGVLKSVFSAKNVKIAWNPGHIQLHSGFKAIGKYLKKTHVLSVNKDEAIELVVTNPEYEHKDIKFLKNSKNLLKVLHAYGVKIVLVTDGKNGADVYDGENFYHQDILKERRRIDTTGVGDAFGSTFTASLELYKGDIQKAMYAASKQTASVIGYQGAQNGLLRRRQLLKK